MVFVKGSSERADFGFFQKPLIFSGLKVNVKCYGSSYACFGLNRMHSAFACFLVKEPAKNMFVNRRIRVLFFNEWSSNLFCAFKVLFYDFFSFFCQRRFCVLATDDFALAANIKRVCYSILSSGIFGTVFRSRVHYSRGT